MLLATARASPEIDAPGKITMFIACEAVCLGEPLSVTETLAAYEPAAVGVPEMAPVAAAIPTPEGSPDALKV